MKLVKYILFYIILITELKAQEIIISRSDVDISRSGFVTATFTFTIDIYINNVKNPNGAAFELKYNLSEYIKFSQWKFGEYGSPQILNLDDGNGNGRLIVALNRGDNPISDSITNSKLISLEFVTLQNAPNGRILNFEFINPIATTISMSGREIVNLNSSKVEYVINGYVNVWPGDADNNGKVDHLDFGPVAQYVGFGSSTKNMRSFKRKSGSAIWGPHQVLAWDSASVTYADCDGNGDITVADMLIVTYNFGKDTNSYKSKNVKDEIQNKYPEPIIYSSENTKKIPLYADLKDNLIGISGIIKFDNSAKYKIYGIEPSNTFINYPYNYSYIKEGELVFALGSYVKCFAKDNLIGYLIVENDFNEQFYISELKGIDYLGSIFDLKLLTNIENDLVDNELKIKDNIIYFDTPFEEISIYDYLGNLKFYFKNIKFLDLNYLSNGVYFIKLNSNNSYKLYKHIKN